MISNSVFGEANSNNTQFGKITKATFVTQTILKNPHIQTILPKYLFKAKAKNLVQERVTTPDQDFIDLAWAMPKDLSVAKGVVVLFHGLEGSMKSHYITHLIGELIQADYVAVVMHFRGCSGEPNLNAIAYHSGATFDPEFIVPLIKARYSHLPLFAVGFSLGGNMLMKLMANRPDLPIDASVCVSAPLNLAASSQTINSGFSRIYQRHLMQSMKANLLKKMTMVDMQATLKVSRQDIQNMQTFEEFDHHITAALHGFRNATDYYTKCSAILDLPAIKKPSLILHAADDPFMDSRVIPSKKLINSNVAYELSDHGGHVGFITKLTGSKQLWLPTRITQFLNEASC